MRILLKMTAFVSFFLYYAVQLIKSNLYISWEIITPKMYVNPGFVRIPVFLNSDFGLLIFSNLLTMIPGSLVVDISEDKKSMLVHVLYSDEEAKIIKQISEIQKHVQKILI